MKPILETLDELKNFKTLIKAIKNVSLFDILSGVGPFTLLAPPNEAFALLYADILDILFRDRIKLSNLLNFHVISEYLTLQDALNRTEITTKNGEKLSFYRDGKIVKVDLAIVFERDILCSNGVVHILDSVLIPKNSKIWGSD